MRALLLAIACCIAPAAFAARYAGVVSHVTDGDSVWVRPADGGPAQQIRVAGIDAPEICQAFGAESREALARRVLHKRVLVITQGQDDYRRIVAHLHLGREDVGRWMVAQGYAWSLHFRHDPEPYRRDELRARRERLGLWRDADPELPREFRVRHGSCH